MTLPSASRKYRLHMRAGTIAEGGSSNENTPVGSGGGGRDGAAGGGHRILPAVGLRGAAHHRGEGGARPGLRPRGRSAPLVEVERLVPARPEDGPLLFRSALRAGGQVGVEEPQRRQRQHG